MRSAFLWTIFTIIMGLFAVPDPYVVFTPERANVLQTLTYVVLALSGSLLIVYIIIAITWCIMRYKRRKDIRTASYINNK